MQRIDRRRTANWQRKDHLFLSAQWRLGIPFPVLENLWLLGKFVQNCAYRIWRKQGGRRGRVITPAKLQLDAVDIVQLINNSASKEGRKCKSANHTPDSGY